MPVMSTGRFFANTLQGYGVTHVFLVPSFGGDVLDRFFNALEGVQESPDRLVALKQAEAMQEIARLLCEPE
jgi:ABC-type transporter lipoprotein component MlaA